MVDINIKPLKPKYDWKIGVLKTVKNAAIFLVPSVLAYLAGIEGEFAPLAGIVAYYIKNWYENR
jgi:hypothetical protein